jgi:hypothetical protein
MLKKSNMLDFIVNCNLTEHHHWCHKGGKNDEKAAPFLPQAFGKPFFLRLVVIHFLITLLSISVTTFFIMQTANNLLTDQAIRHNMQSLESVNTYFENQSQSFKKFSARFIRPPSA